ncbi:MAG: ribosomal protein S18-alanine N-acetyltransferase [Bacilli bacterium]|nr:ribosomal protein S18-alanine N-acetyltransferase [Bacilli bacterium]MDD4809511.1 ribosomal protein S18-alanine N-acetyltransferase [Bacilli bacterium]
MIKEIDDLSLLNDLTNDYRVTMNPYTRIMGYEIDHKIVGFIDYSIIYDKAELNYIIVLNNYRNQHIASELMDYFILDINNNGCLNITLEVKKSNQSALNLYRKYGFKEVGIRSNYYQNEDGILMMKVM